MHKNNLHEFRKGRPVFISQEFRERTRKHGCFVQWNKKLPLEYFERAIDISTINLSMAKKETKS